MGAEEIDGGDPSYSRGPAGEEQENSGQGETNAS